MDRKINAIRELVGFLLRTEGSTSDFVRTLIKGYIDEKIINGSLKFIRENDIIIAGIKNLDISMFEKLELIPYDRLPSAFMEEAKVISESISKKLTSGDLSDKHIRAVWDRIDILINDEPFWKEFTHTDEFRIRRKRLDDMFQK